MNRVARRSWLQGRRNTRCSRLMCARADGSRDQSIRPRSEGRWARLMIVSVCADKASSPSAAGVSTLALAVGMVWPGDRLVLEADPSGGDVLFYLPHADGGLLHPEPTLLSLTADARAHLDPRSLPAYAQPTSLGVPVILGPPTPESFAPAGPLWPRLAEAAAGWDGVVLADLGRLHPRHAAAAALLPLSHAVVLLTTADVVGLYRLRERVTVLAGQLVPAPAPDAASRLLVAVRTTRSQRRQAMMQVAALLDSIGSPALLAGVVLDDARAATAIKAGTRPAQRGTGAGLVGSARELIRALGTLGVVPSSSQSPDFAPARDEMMRPITAQARPQTCGLARDGRGGDDRPGVGLRPRPGTAGRGRRAAHHGSAGPCRPRGAGAHPRYRTTAGAELDHRRGRSAHARSERVRRVPAGGELRRAARRRRLRRDLRRRPVAGTTG